MWSFGRQSLHTNTGQCLIKLSKSITCCLNYSLSFRFRGRGWILCGGEEGHGVLPEMLRSTFCSWYLQPLRRVGDEAGLEILDCSSIRMCIYYTVIFLHVHEKNYTWFLYKITRAATQYTNIGEESSHELPVREFYKKTICKRVSVCIPGEIIRPEQNLRVCETFSEYKESTRCLKNAPPYCDDNFVKS